MADHTEIMPVYAETALLIICPGCKEYLSVLLGKNKNYLTCKNAWCPEYGKIYEVVLPKIQLIPSSLNEEDKRKFYDNKIL